MFRIRSRALIARVRRLADSGMLDPGQAAARVADLHAAANDLQLEAVSRELDHIELGVSSPSSPGSPSGLSGLSIPSGPDGSAVGVLEEMLSSVDVEPIPPAPISQVPLPQDERPAAESAVAVRSPRVMRRLFFNVGLLVLLVGVVGWLLLTWSPAPADGPSTPGGPGDSGATPTSTMGNTSAESPDGAGPVPQAPFDRATLAPVLASLTDRFPQQRAVYVLFASDGFVGVGVEDDDGTHHPWLLQGEEWVEAGEPEPNPPGARLVDPAELRVAGLVENIAIARASAPADVEQVRVRFTDAGDGGGPAVTVEVLTVDGRTGGLVASPQGTITERISYRAG